MKFGYLIRVKMMKLNVGATCVCHHGADVSSRKNSYGQGLNSDFDRVGDDFADLSSLYNDYCPGSNDDADHVDESVSALLVGLHDCSFPDQKKTQKTSKADLDLAAKRYRDLLKELSQ